MSHRIFKKVFLLCIMLILANLSIADSNAESSNSLKKKSFKPPNIVYVMMDNFGWGELGVYGGGILRGAPTPRLDTLASEGLRLLNFNVETVCTASRAALMTGRYSIRTGNETFPRKLEEVSGLVQWEVTLAEMLRDAGYVTGHFGKWNLGSSEGRYPTNQGFDEWYGIRDSTYEIYGSNNPFYNPSKHPSVKPSYVMEGRKGSISKNVKVFSIAQRELIDEEITSKTIDFINRSVKKGAPFFAYVPYTQTHDPIKPHPDFKGKTGNGDFADVLAQIDHYIGRLLDTIDQQGIADNTIFIFTSDNGTDISFWSGDYVSGAEGGLRVPFLMR
ncbi:MAG: sulfatase-like hydrolase/transferase, partial [Porticoccaceae bacterium]|nr:sulfatase-like hydrolase/transferase [Porticoccaceae bacterium]